MSGILTPAQRLYAIERPSLLMDFVGGGGFDSGLITHTRASAQVVGRAGDGQLVSLTDNVFTTDHDANGNPLGLTLEGAATQLLRFPDDLSSYWSNAATLTGTHTLTDNSGADELRSNQIVSIATTNQNWVLQAHIEKDNDETRFPQITAYLYGGTAADTCYCHINTKTGAVTKSDSSGGASTVSSADGGDYWIVWITINNAHANTGADISLWPAAGTVFGTRSVAATGSAVFRYVNFVASSVRTSPILTLPQLTTAPLDFSNAAWTKDAGVTVSADAAVAPDGTTTMDEITFPASSSNTIYANTSMVTATPHVASVFLKQSDAGGRYVQIAGRTNGFGITPYVNLDLQTGTLGNGAGTSYGVVPYPNGVYRLYFISTTTGTATNNGGIVINVVDSLTALRFSGRTAAGKIYAWAANLVASSTLISPILTATATATRAATVATLATSAFGYSQSQGTWLVEASKLGLGTSGYLLSINDQPGGDDDRFDLYVSNSTNKVHLLIQNAGVTKFNSDVGSAITANTDFAASFSYGPAGVYCSVNGCTPISVGPVTFPSVDTVSFGMNQANGSTLDGSLRRVAYYETPFNADVQSLAVVA
jgi:hypothetical protein